ncbi:MAG TPA: hypothetical protein VM692_10175 [Gammaproteobacteria bacterium]|nr:hypothetical protein [Gammaproteobacteria bacterium]
MVSKPWAWLTGVAWLFAALTNAHGHIHFCFDGKEPPAAVHLTDSSDHDHELPGHDASGDHDDLDVDLPNQALAKACKHDLAVIAPVLVWTAGFVTPSTTTPIAADPAPPVPDTLYYRPPSRAPPR